MNELITKGQKVKEASMLMGRLNTKQKNQSLLTIADELVNHIPFIVEENRKDIESAKEKGFHESLIDRLVLNEQRITDISNALKELVEITDPVGEKLEAWNRPNGLEIEKVRVPLGVVGMIYEARPNVTVDAASLCLKTGNAVLLRGSSSALHSNKALVSVIHKALDKTDLPATAVQLVEDTSRETASKMFKLNDYLDVLIPRGGKKLIDTVVNQSTVPVLETGAGNCHLYIDETADPTMAISIAINAKTQRPSVCNALETVLIHHTWAEQYLEQLVEKFKNEKVEIHADKVTNSLVSYKLIEATEEDWETEFLDKIVAMKVVSNVEEAIEHINRYGSQHSEAIISENEHNVLKFFNDVDAAALYHNASTRFTDGFEFGFGAEIGISTQKLHARGPMGLPALTSTKYIIRGDGQIKE